MLIVKGKDSIKWGRTIYPKDKLPYIKVTILKENKTVDAGSVIWDTKKEQYEIRTRKETELMVRMMERKR